MLQIHAAYTGDCLVNFLSQKIVTQDTAGHLYEVHRVLDWNFTMYELPKVSRSIGLGKIKGRKVWEIVAPILVAFSVAVTVHVIAAQKTNGKIEEES